MLTHLHKAAKPHGDPTENRTPVSSVRGSRPRPLDDGAIKMGYYNFFIIAPPTGTKRRHTSSEEGVRGPEGPVVIPLIP